MSLKDHKAPAVLALFAGLLLLLSGVLLIAPTGATARLALLTMHLVVGIGATAPIVLVTARHARRLRRSDGYNVVMVLTAGALLVVLGTGLLLLAGAVLPGGAKGSVTTVHDVATVALVVATLVHCVQALERARLLRAAATTGGLLTAAGVVLAVLVGGSWPVDRGASPVPLSDVHTNPLAPSRVRVDGDRLLEPSRLGGSARCAECHPAIYRQWAESMHAASAVDEHVAHGIRGYVRSNGVAAGRMCGGCHDPINLLAGAFDPAQVSREVSAEPHPEGVSCLGCHAIREVHTETLGNGSYTIEPPAIALPGGLDRVLTGTSPVAHRRAVMRRPLMQQAEICGACHQQILPGVVESGPQDLHQQFPEWKAGPYSDPAHEDFETCQGCHMELVEADDPAAVDGKVHDHRMPGGNHEHPVSMGYPDQAEAVLAMLRDGLELDLVVPDQQADGTLRIEANLTNAKVGHRFPTGATDVAEAWIELIVGDPAAPLFTSGLLDERYYLDPEAQVWRTVFADNRNVPVDLHDLKRITKIVSSRQVAPGETDVASWSVPLPAQRPSDLAVRARLRTRRAGQRWNDWQFNFDGRTVPVTDVFVIEQNIDLGALQWHAAPAPTEPTPPGPRTDPVAPEGMVYVPAGTSTIGDDLRGGPDERPQQLVQVEAFFMDEVPVTNAEYREYLVEQQLPSGPRLLMPWAEPFNWNGTRFPAGTALQPVILVTWNEADRFCRSTGGSLPTEAQWERAARGDDGRAWPWGDTFDGPACPAAGPGDVPLSVGACPDRASPFGILDLVGGVFEWTGDPYLAYDRGVLHPNANEWVSTLSPLLAAVRGAPGWAVGPASYAWSRSGHNTYQRSKIGFRCAKEVTP